MKFRSSGKLQYVPSDGRDTAGMVSSIVETKQTEDPFFLIDLGDVHRKHQQWLRMMPRVQPFYAVKCCNEEYIIRSLVALGANFDCASMGEIKQVMKLGVDPSRIIYANPAKPISQLRFAREVGVNVMTFDNECELQKIKEHHPAAQLVLRILADDPAAICSFGVKFGAHPDHAANLLRSAQALGLCVIGVSFHVGSGCQTADIYRQAIQAAKNIFDDGEALGFSMTLLDIGGGFPGVETASGISFRDIANVVNSAVDTIFSSHHNLRVIAEPGRYYVASACTLVVNVTSKRVVQPLPAAAAAAAPQFMYFINDGLYGSLNNVIYDHASPLPKMLRAPRDKDAVFECSLWGPTCDSMDCITRKCVMPELEIGDWLYFENAGAYTLAAGSTFNGFDRPTHVYTFALHPMYVESELPADYPLHNIITA
jgi:ornithine decarboxylase